jgi:excisionase family DNA binding protein
MASNQIEALLTPKEVASIFKCSLPLVYKWASNGRLRSIRVPCPGEGEKKKREMVRFDKADIIQFIQENRK